MGGPHAGDRSARRRVDAADEDQPGRTPASRSPMTDQPSAAVAPSRRGSTLIRFPFRRGVTHADGQVQGHAALGLPGPLAGAAEQTARAPR